jgi:hypothetical protein
VRVQGGNERDERKGNKEKRQCRGKGRKGKGGMGVGEVRGRIERQAARKCDEDHAIR